MITHTIKLYLIPFISSQNYIVQGYTYKSMNLIKPRIYVKGVTNYLVYIKYESSSTKNGLRSVKKVETTV